MSDLPKFGQRSDANAAPPCPRHPGARSVDYCKRCNRPMCVECAIRTEVRSVCVDCARQERPRWSPRGAVVTKTMMGICIALYLIGFISPTLERTFMFAPIVGLSEPWRFVTTAFLHASFLHLAFNMLALYWVGLAVEPVLGRWRFAALYLLSAFGGTVAVLLWCLVDRSAVMVATVGASGAVFGLFAAVFVLQKLGGADTTAVVVLLCLNLVYGFISSGVSWQAHVGGLLVGGLVTWLFARLARPRAGLTARRQERQQMLAAAGVAVALVALTSGVYALLLS